MTRVDIINALINKYGYEKYLEIGVNVGDSIKGVSAKYKVGVDPIKQCEYVNYELTSDDFFKQNKEKFDIIFIDGLHISDQVVKDFINSVEYLNDYGCIVLHDCNPHSEYLQTVPPTCPEWTGDVWKAIVAINSGYGYDSFVVDTDYGVGVYFPRHHKVYSPNVTYELTWEWLVENRKEALNLISVDEFRKFLEVGFDSNI